MLSLRRVFIWPEFVKIIHSKIIHSKSIHTCIYRIAGNFRGSAISSQFVVLFSWFLLGLQVKVGKVASFVGKIFVVHYSTTKTMNILPHENLPAIR